MPFPDLVPYSRSVNADLAALTPLYDFVLVKELHSVVKGRTSSLIMDPGHINQTKDGRILHNRPRGLRIGEVIAVGRGDKKPDGSRHVMYVKRGDRVIYPRVEANDVILNGEAFTFCHAEQHILGIVED